MDEYPHSLLSALEAWMNHDPELRLIRADKLREELTIVEPEFKQCTVQCYRRMDFPKDPRDNPRRVPLPLLDLFHTGKLEESISSWTTDPRVAKDHMEGVQSDATCVIFKHVPSPGEVWVDLSRLLRAPAFQKALGHSGFPAIRQWMTKESEVILEVPSVSPQDVYAWGSFAGNVEQLLDAAVAEGLSSEEIAALRPKLEQQAGKEGWLPEERSLAVAARMSVSARQQYIHPPPLAETTS